MSDTIGEIKKKIELLNYWTKKYDEGYPIVSDAEWDALYFELEELEKRFGVIFPESPTQKISFTVVNQLQKVTHNHPMLSLAKTKDLNEVATFIRNKDYIAMCKMDGLTCSLKYENGILVAAETRGDGLVGEDVLHNVQVMWNVPKTITYTDTLIVDGEIICDYETFKQFNTEYKNPRNFAAGSIRLLDSKESHKRGLSFIAWDVIEGLRERTLHGKLQHLKALNFTIVPYITHDSEEFSDVEYLKKQAEENNYPIDGIVFKYDDIEYYQSLGNTEHHFRGGLAYKFYDEEVETTLRDIEWTMGRTGQITPIALFEKVHIDGTEVSRASLSNISIMEKTLGRNPFKGQKIYVSKRNMIIPKVERAKDENDQWI